MQDLDLKDPQDQRPEEYEEPVLLGAEDLDDVAGGCAFACQNGDCRPAP